MGLWFNFVTNLQLQTFGLNVTLMQLATIVLAPGLFGFALWRLWLALKGKGTLSIVWSAAIAVSALIVLWGSLVFHLLHLGLE